jgi:uncharacterized protein
MRAVHRLLSHAEKARLHRIAEDLERETGAELAVLLLRHVADVDDFATRYFNHAGIGKRAHHNGVLILVALAPRRIRIEVGRGLEAVLTGDRAARIIADLMAPAFRAGRYGEGVLRGAEAIAGLIRTAHGAGARGAGALGAGPHGAMPMPPEEGTPP